MKRTKNMKYNKTDAARELYLYMDNEPLILNYHIEAVIKSLRKKAKKGIYDSNKAVDAFYHVATFAAKRYMEAYPWSYRFTVGDRFTAATDMEEDYREIIFMN